MGNSLLHPQHRTGRKEEEYQVVVAVFGAQHGGHLPQVGGVALLVHTAREGDGDDPLGDVDQVQLVGLVQHLQQAHAPVGRREERERLSAFMLFEDVRAILGISAPDRLYTQIGVAATDSEKLIPRSNTSI